MKVIDLLENISPEKIRVKDVLEIVKNIWLEHGVSEKSADNATKQLVYYDIPMAIYRMENRQHLDVDKQFFYMSDLYQIAEDYDDEFGVTPSGNEHFLNAKTQDYPLTVLKTWKMIWRAAGLGTFRL